ncbi:ParA family protein [Mucilaginibacter sp. UYCu711]|uniref:ParA family protein n=1 Tax=Mucilaginibacter sp. UYCu711 TaxID=3156339 RepID=UPI003D1A0D0D
MKKQNARIFLIGNRKGGVGKSFTTINLATSLCLDFKKSVCIIECDSQKSISKIRNKEQNANENETPPYPVIYTPVKSLQQTILENITLHDYIFIDMPRITNEDDNSEKEQEEVLNLLMFAESILIPVGAHELDLDGSDDFIELINELRDYRIEKKLPFSVYAFHNRSRGIKEDEMIPEWAEAVNIPLFDTTVKESVHLERNLSTFSSIKSVNDVAAKGAKNNYLNFINEFVTKFNIN